MYVDSNIFIYAAIDSTEKGEKARKVIDKIANGEIKAYISPLVIDEVMWVIQKMVNRETAHEVGSLIISLPLIWLDISYETVKTSLSVYERGLDPRDAFHVSVMEEYNISEILSEDKDFDKISEIKRYSLGDIISA